jgi:hypothetical protein
MKADPAVTAKIELSKLSLELFKFVQMNAGEELLDRSKFPFIFFYFLFFSEKFANLLTEIQSPFPWMFYLGF